jgi:metal-responsive CopG/Arc/MetJ family transcriptional regulator
VIINNLILGGNFESRTMNKQNTNYAKTSMPINQCFDIERDIALLHLDSLNDVIYSAHYAMAKITNCMTNSVVKGVELK